MVPATTSGASVVTRIPENLLWKNLREIFSPENASYAIKFWTEKKMGGFVLRRVEKLERATKNGDYLVGRTPASLLAVKIMIGNSLEGRKLSGIRWELYEDFELTRLSARGRFDTRDLTGDHEEAEWNLCSQYGIVPNKDWDFDGLIALHSCEACKKPYNTDSVVYVGDKKCSHCNTTQTEQMAMNHLLKLARQYAYTRNSLPLHRTEKRAGIADYIDPIPNSIIYWMITHPGAGNLGHPNNMCGGPEFHEILKDVYRYSLFRLMEIDCIREAFNELLGEVEPEKWELFLSFCGKAGRAFTRTAGPEAYEDLKTFQGFNFVEYFSASFSEFINQVVLKHQEVQEAMNRRNV